MDRKKGRPCTAQPILINSVLQVSTEVPLFLKAEQAATSCLQNTPQIKSVDITIFHLQRHQKWIS